MLVSHYKDEELWFTVENLLNVPTSICTFFRTKSVRGRGRTKETGHTWQQRFFLWVWWGIIETLWFFRSVCGMDVGTGWANGRFEQELRYPDCCSSELIANQYPHGFQTLKLDGSADVLLREIWCSHDCLLDRDAMSYGRHLPTCVRPKIQRSGSSSVYVYPLVNVLDYTVSHPRT
jgi:hypothetical protein